MKQVGMFALLIAGVCAGVVLGLELGSAEGVKAVAPPEMLSERLDTDDPYLAALRKAESENDALRAELDLARVVLEDRQLEGEALLARLDRLKAEGLARMEASGERSAEIEARIAELEAQLEDERMHRLNMVEEAIERRGLNKGMREEPVASEGAFLRTVLEGTVPNRGTLDVNARADALLYLWAIQRKGDGTFQELVNKTDKDE